MDRILRAGNAPEGTTWVALYQTGSIMHGVHLPPEQGGVDDLDWLLIGIPPVSHALGFYDWEGGAHASFTFGGARNDVTTYSLRKFGRLLARGNPNVVATLWSDSDRMATRAFLAGRVELRQAVLSKQLGIAAAGYADGQIKRMRNGSRNGYMGERRAQMLEAHGYDPKNAAHAVRIMRMGREAMTNAWLTVNRAGLDADELLAIKRGDLSLDDVVALIEAEAKALRHAIDVSKLPERANCDAVSRWLVQAHMAVFGR